MSLLILLQGDFGTVISSDSYESDPNLTHAVNKKAKKVFKIGTSAVLGVAGDLSFLNSENRIVRTETLIRDITKDGWTGAHTFIERFCELAPDGCIFDFLIGERSNGKFGSYAGYSFEVQGKEVANSSIIKDHECFFAAGMIHCFPAELMSVNARRMSVEEMRRYNYTAIHAAMEAGKSFVDAGLINYFPVGGDIQHATLS